MGKTAQEQRRMDHLRMLAGIFDSPRMRKIQEKAREEKGDCWDCRRALKVGHISTGRGVRMVVISCRATNNGAPVVRRLPFHCWYWEKKEKLQVLEGGGENGKLERLVQEHAAWVKAIDGRVDILEEEILPRPSECDL